MLKNNNQDIMFLNQLEKKKDKIENHIILIDLNIKYTKLYKEFMKYKMDTNKKIRFLEKENNMLKNMVLK